MARTAGLLATMLTAALAAAVCLTAGAASGEPGRCIRELPSKRTEHWSYHIVNGQRCWYPDSAGTTVGRKIRVERRERAQERAQGTGKLVPMCRFLLSARRRRLPASGEMTVVRKVC